jgi:hypothetical protein
VSRHYRVPGTSSKPLRVLYLLADIPDAAPADVKNPLALRNAAATSGVCPDCGAVGELHSDSLPGVFHLIFRHEDDCGVLCDPEAA